MQASAPTEDVDKDPDPPSGASGLIADPFLHQSTDVVSSPQPGLNTSATPWLTDEQQQRMADQAATGQINLGAAHAPDGIAEPQRAAASPWLKDEQQTSNPEPAVEPAVEPVAVAEPAPESIAALDAADEKSEADDASEPNEPRDDPATVEPDAEVSQVSEPGAEPIEIKPEPPPDPGISDAVRQRLESGMLLVALPDSQPTPSEDQSTSATSDKGSGRWSWLRSALGRS